MKTLKIVAIFCLTLFFISCSTEDLSPIDTNAQEQDLIGSWKLIEITQDGTTQIQGIPVKSNFSSIGKDIDAQVVFAENPKDFVSSGSYTSVVTVAIIGQPTTQEIPEEINNFLNQGTWVINQGIITVTKNNESQTVNITELTSTSLKLEMEFEEVIVTQGVTNIFEGIAKMSLVKL